MVSKVFNVLAVIILVAGIVGSICIWVVCYENMIDGEWIGFFAFLGGCVASLILGCVLRGFAIIIKFCENNMNLSYYTQKLHGKDNAGSSRGYQKDLMPIFKDELPDL